MKNIKQILLPSLGALCVGLMIGIFIGSLSVRSSVQLSTSDKISEDLPTQTVPYRFDTAGKININTATADELTMLPGIGKTTADNIVAYRLQYGPFLRTKDITKVKGIGPSRFKKIEELITVGG